MTTLKMKDKVRRAAVVAALALTAGCMSSPLTFVTSSIPVDHGHYTVLAEEVTGTNTQMSWLFFSFGLGGSGQRHALRDALQQVPGADALIAMSVDTEDFILFPFLLPSFYTTRVSGTPVKTSANGN